MRSDGASHCKSASKQPKSQAHQKVQIKGYLPVQQHAALGNAREALEINMAQSSSKIICKTEPKPTRQIKYKHQNI